MKKIVLIITMIGVYTIVSAQKYIPKLTLNKFAGTWVYKKDGKEVKIVLKKVKTPIKDIIIDEIQGYYIYKVNDKIIENTQRRERASLRDGGYDFDAGKDTNRLTLAFFDSIKRKTGDILLTFKHGTPNEMHATLINKEGSKIQIEGQAKFDKTFTLPQDMILTKKED